LNLVAFNVGYHNEHHDFPSVPWNRLPRVREAGRQYYDGLVFHTSWTKLLFKFLFDPSLSLFSRMVRHKRGSIPLDDEVKPDIDLLQDMNRGMPPGNGS
jgi:sphingolipid delta-4 desaturase